MDRRSNRRGLAPQIGRGFVLGAAIALAASCSYSPGFSDCAISCSSASGCPSGMTCGAEGLCRPEGAGGSCNAILDAHTADAVLTDASTALYTLTVSIEGSSTGAITSDPGGINCGASCMATYASGTVLSMTALPGSATTAFTGWGGACMGTSDCTIIMDATKALTAQFDEGTVVVSVSGSGDGLVTSTPGGITCNPDCTEDYLPGTDIVLTAMPDSTSLFAGWSGVCSGAGDCTLDDLVGSNHAYAEFTRNRLIVALLGPGTGEVTSTPGGIACGPTCQADYSPGTEVTLTPSADSTTAFTGWSGACTGSGECVLTMNGPANVGARFEPTTVEVTVTGDGVVTSSPAGIDCGATCSFDFPAYSTVTLTATATGDDPFGGWTGDCTGTGSCVLEMNGLRSVEADFPIGGCVGNTDCDPADCCYINVCVPGDRVGALCFPT